MSSVVGLCLTLCGRAVPDSFEGSFRFGLPYSIYLTRLAKVVAYSIRIMLSHVRIKADGFNQKADSNDPSELQELYAMISIDRAAQGPEAEASEPPSIPNPFLSFREASDSEHEYEPEAADDEAVCVYKQLQIGETVMMSIMLMSDGAKIPAEKYSSGPDGFIVCHWKDGDTFQTEVPNKYLGPQGQFIMKPSQAAPEPVVRKSKDKKNKDEKDAEAKGKTKAGKAKSKKGKPKGKPKAKNKAKAKAPATTAAEELGASDAHSASDISGDSGNKQDRFVLKVCNGRALLDQGFGRALLD
jgi:hypothetical protein